MEKKMTREQIHCMLHFACEDGKKVIIKVRTQPNETVEIPLYEPELTLGYCIESKIKTRYDWGLAPNGNVWKKTYIVDGMYNISVIENNYRISNIESVIFNSEE